MKLGQGLGETARGSGGGGAEKTIPNGAGLPHFAAQGIGRRRAATEGLEEFSEALEFGAENADGRRGLPRRGQVEQEGSGRRAGSDGIKGAPELVAGGGKNDGGIGGGFGKTDGGLGKGADAGGERGGAWLEIIGRADEPGLEAVGADPFGRDPGGG
jgi:hypothetical protein